MFVKNFIACRFKSERIGEICKSAMKTAKISFAALEKLIHSPMFQCAVIVLLIIAVAALPAFAQLDSGSDSGVETTAKNLFDRIYTKWRVP